MDLVVRKVYIYGVYMVYMVQAMINISPEANHILNIVKARNNLKDKSEAIMQIVLEYGAESLEPELRPEFIKKMGRVAKEGTVRVTNFSERYGL